MSLLAFLFSAHKYLGNSANSVVAMAVKLCLAAPNEEDVSACISVLCSVSCSANTDLFHQAKV